MLDLSASSILKFTWLKTVFQDRGSCVLEKMYTVVHKCALWWEHCDCLVFPLHALSFALSCFTKQGSVAKAVFGVLLCTSDSLMHFARQT